MSLALSRWIATALGAGLVASACAVQHDVPLVLEGLDDGRPAGFLCRAPSATGGAPHLAELVAPRLRPCEARCGAGVCRREAYVFDFLEVGGVPSCSGATLADWCSEPGRCRVAQRRCVEIDACVATSTASSAESVADGLRSANGGVITDAPPEGTVLVRLVGSAQSCAEIESQGLARQDVFGCAYSCPVQLAVTEGAVQLDLATLDDECGQAVYGCALFVSGSTPVAP